MATVKDQTKWMNLDAMHPENMQALLVALAQGTFMIEDVLPVIPGTDEFMYEQETNNTKFNRAIKRGEKGVAGKNSFQMEQKTASAWEYFESYDITAKTLRKDNLYNFINVMVKGMDTIAGKIRLATELDGIEAFTGASGINSISAVGAYSSASASDPYADIVKAKKEIVLDEMVQANAIVMGAENESELKLSDAVRDIKMYTYDYINNGVQIGSIDGTKVYVAHARYNSAGTLTPVLNGTIIVTVAGYAGELREAQPYEADSDYNKSTKTLTLFGSRVIRPLVHRPEAACLITGC